MHKIQLDNSDYHYVSELLAFRATEIQKLLVPTDLGNHPNHDKLNRELDRITALLSDKFISV